MRGWVCIVFLIAVECFSQKRYELNCREELVNVSLDSAICQVGIREKSNRNDGDVEKYLRIFNLKRGNPYCAAGQYWCFYRAALDLKMSLKEIPLLKSALAFAMFNHAKNNGVRTNFNPVRNDLIFWRKKNSVRGHVERIISVGKSGVVFTVGFNTVNKNTGEEGVFLQKRNLHQPLGRLVVRGVVGFDLQFAINN
jgi:hypothetical protein